MKITDCRVGFAGFGHMGQIILQSVLSTKLIPKSQFLFHRRDASRARENEQTFGITSTSLEHLVSYSDLILICVRPSQAKELFEQITKVDGFKTKIYLSIMAGIPISSLRKSLGQGPTIIRAMPNIASSVGEGMTLLSFEPHLDLDRKELSTMIFGSIGQVEHIAEEQMDIGCGMAGSGPAFIIELIEALARLGADRGLAYDQALRIAAQTFSGAAALILRGGDPRTLLGQIATPKGTTVAGLEALKNEGGAHSLKQAVLASAHRSHQLSLE